MCEPREKLKDFALEEWKDLRQQVNILLSAIWRLEMSTIAGLAIYYGWYFTYESKLLDIVHVASLLAPVIFMPLIIARLKIEYAILMRLGRYCERVENMHCGRPYARLSDENAQGDDGSPIGWQRYLSFYPPDSIPFRDVARRYSHAFLFFIIVALICTAFAVYRLEPWMMILEAGC